MGIRLIVLVAYTLAVAAGAVALLEVARPTLAHSGSDRPGQVARAILRAPWNYARALLRPTPVEELKIDIQFKHLHRIHEKRADALRRGVLIAGDDDLVPATISHGARTVPVEIRLSGAVENGLEGERWPLRVETAPDTYLLGMRRFTLLDPGVRGFQTERFPTAHLRSLEIVTPRAFFVTVVLNGKSLGVMLLEEHFAKELLESQQRRDGTILRFDDDPYWDSFARWGSHGAFDSHRTAQLVAFGAGRVRRSKSLSEQRATGIGLLTGFLEGRLPAREVFDLPLMGDYLAVAELWQSSSALRWDQLRFYLNPLSSRLEPVGPRFAMQAPHVGDGLAAADSPVASAMLADPDLRDAFVAAAHRIADDVLDGDLVSRMQAMEKRDLELLHAEYPWQMPFDFDRIRQRARRLRNTQAADVASFGAALAEGAGAAAPLHASVRREASGYVLELSNALPVALEVVELSRRRGDDPARDLAAELGLALPLTLAPTPLGTTPAALRVEIPDGGGKRPRVEGVARLAGRAETVAFRSSKADTPLARNPVHHPALDDVLASHPFLRFDPAGARLVAAPGRFTVKGSLVLPQGMGLLLPAGTELRFAAGEGLVARGALEFAGTAEAPVVLTGPVSNDAADMWSGIAVLGADTPSRWTHVHVHHTGGFAREGWRLTGGIVFRKAALEMQSCRILDSRAEDALNVVRAPFSLLDVEISGSGSDAFDADFSDGNVTGGIVRDARGDGIDVSGSVVELRGVTLQDIGDKAISVGEGSRLRASELTIRSVGTAFVSKDRSQGELRDSTIRGVLHVALMAYVKKAEYGPAELVSEDNQIEDYGRLGLAQTGSRVFVDGTPLPEQDVDIGQLYREGYMRK